MDAVELIRFGQGAPRGQHSPGPGPRADGAYIRRAARQYKVPLVTTVAAARAAAAGVLERAGHALYREVAPGTPRRARLRWAGLGAATGRGCPGPRAARQLDMTAPVRHGRPAQPGYDRLGDGRPWRRARGLLRPVAARGGRREVAVGRCRGPVTRPRGCCRPAAACSTASGCRTRGSTPGCGDDLPGSRQRRGPGW